MLTCGYYTLVRMDGVTGDFRGDDQLALGAIDRARFLGRADRSDRESAGKGRGSRWCCKPAIGPASADRNRDNRVTGVKIPTDWDKEPAQAPLATQGRPGLGVVRRHRQSSIHAGAVGPE